MTSATPAGVRSRNRGRASPSITTRSARIRAEELRPKVTTRARVRSAIAVTAGSSALSTATPFSGSASTSSLLARMIASRPPNSPTCALPTPSTTPISGRTTGISAAMSPTCRAPSSLIRKRLSAVASSTVSGTPSSLLRFPGGATVGPSRPSTCPSRSLVEVLPDDPVTAIRRSAGSRLITSVASNQYASRTSSTTTAGTPTGREASTAVAPAAMTCSAKSWPSRRDPAKAANIPPGSTRSVS